MKAILSNRILIDVTEAQLEEIMDSTTYSIPHPRPYLPDSRPTIIRTYKRITKKLVSVPIGRTDLIPEDCEIVDNRVEVPVKWPNSNFELRPSQKEVYDLINDNYLLNAKVGWGKTITALAIAKKFGQRTLVLVHNSNLLHQWTDKVKEFFGSEAAVLGGGRKDDVEDSFITIGLIQTVIKVLPEIRNKFGLLIIDEVHRLPADTMTTISDTMPCRFRLGLSGTLERKDGRHVVLKDYISKDVVAPVIENTVIPEVYVIQMPEHIVLPPHKTYAARITLLGDNPDFVELMCKVACAFAKKGHNVLLLFTRLSFLRNCHEICSEVEGVTSHLITSQSSKAERDAIFKTILETKGNILNGTQTIFSEGVSVDSLSTVILANPVNNLPLLEQIIGRVTRPYHDKEGARVVDFKYSGSTGTAARQFSIRRGHYLDKGYVIKNINLTNGG